ncbi:hypothetical protein RF55_14931 [Lasius niger]|uniref:Uncharacterized protein n=1 Tax=Lasius niger TaxID=67767 RepID=A0A0J7N0K1_LASNI|nr:hypothetical protein RF55_14931 [Lasius niger]
MEGEGKKAVKDEKKKRVGRPKKVKELGKERRGRTGCLEEFWKRKRGGTDEEEIEKEDWSLKRSKKVEGLQKCGKRLGREELEEMIGVIGEKVMRRICDEMGKMRKEIRQREEKWREEKREMKEKIQGLEMRIQEMKGKLERKIKEGGSLVEGGVRGGKEEREREIKKGVEKVLEKIGAKVKIEEVRRAGGKYGKEGRMVVVKLGSREQKREIMEKKKRLMGRKIRIEDDLTWEERKIRWKIREIAEEERRKGNRVWIGYGKIRINECWWRWDEEVGKLMNWRGEIREESIRPGEGGI